jgi:phage baseplate assembly protein W
MATTIYGTQPMNPEIGVGVEGKQNKIYGFGFPAGSLKGKGFFFAQADIALLKNNIHQLLLTEQGERIMFPSYGMSLKKYLFQPLDKLVVENISDEIKTQISNFIPQVKIGKLHIYESDNINYMGGHGIRIRLDLVATQLNNTIFTVGAEII